MKFDTGSGWVDPEPDEPSGLHPDIEASLVGLGNRTTHWPAYEELHQHLAAQGHPAAMILKSPGHLQRAYHDYLLGITPPQYRHHPTFKQALAQGVRQVGQRTMVSPEVGRFVENRVREK